MVRPASRLREGAPWWGERHLFSVDDGGDNWAGLDAGHQTGWTTLVAGLLDQQGRG